MLRDSLLQVSERCAEAEYPDAVQGMSWSATVIAMIYSRTVTLVVNVSLCYEIAKSQTLHWSQFFFKRELEIWCQWLSNLGWSGYGVSVARKNYWRWDFAVQWWYTRAGQSHLNSQFPNYFVSGAKTISSVGIWFLFKHSVLRRSSQYFAYSASEFNEVVWTILLKNTDKRIERFWIIQ